MSEYKPRGLGRRFKKGMSGVALAALMCGVTPAHAMTLTEALAQTYMHNPDLEAARRQLEGTDETMAQAVSEFRPQVDAFYSRGREEASYNGAPKTESTTEVRQLQIVQPIFNGGGSIAGVQSAKAGIIGQRYAYYAAEQDILREAATAYVGVARARELLRLTEKNEEVLRQHGKATGDRFEVGEVTRTDVSQAEARLARATSDRVRAQADLVASIAAFERLVRQPAPKPENMEMDELKLELPKAVDEAIAKGLANNPTLRQREQLAEQASSNVWRQRSGLLPRVDAVGQTRRSDGSINAGGGQFDSDTVTLNLTVPLYESGRTWSTSRQASRQKEQRQEEYLDVQNRVREAVMGEWERLQSAKAVIISSKEAIKAAETALGGVEQEYQFGSRTTLDVLDAEQELFQVRVNLVSAEHDEMVSRFRLASFLGDFTAAALQLPVELYDTEKYYDKVKYKFIGW